MSGFRYGACLAHRFDPARRCRDGARAVAGHDPGRLQRSVVGEPPGSIALGDPASGSARAPATSEAAAPAPSPHAVLPSAADSKPAPLVGEKAKAERLFAPHAGRRTRAAAAAP